MLLLCSAAHHTAETRRLRLKVWWSSTNQRPTTYWQCGVSMSNNDPSTCKWTKNVKNNNSFHFRSSWKICKQQLLCECSTCWTSVIVLYVCLIILHCDYIVALYVIQMFVFKVVRDFVLLDYYSALWYCRPPLWLTLVDYWYPAVRQHG